MPIGCQSALGDEVAKIVKGRQAMPRGEFNNLTAMRISDRARQYDEPGVRLARSRGDGLFEIGAVACAGDGHIHLQRRRSGLDGARYADLSCLAWIENDRSASEI